MGGARVTFTIDRGGRPVEVTMNVPYRPGDTGARANAHLEQSEIDLVRQAVQGVVAQGTTITGDTFTIVEDDSDLRNPPTARDLQRLPVSVLLGPASAVTGGGTVTGSPPGAPPVAGDPTPIEGTDLGVLHNRTYRRTATGWVPVNPISGPTGPNPGPNGSPPPSPPPAGGGNGGNGGNGASGPERRTQPPSGGSHPGPRPHPGGGAVGMGDVL